MKRTFYFISALIFVAAIAAGFTMTSQKEVKHVVVFKYKETATTDQINQITTAFKALKKSIPGIVSLQNGTNMSPENLNKGFTHIYLVTFKDEAARDAYLPHPQHKKFGELLGSLGVLEDVFVVDFHPED